MTTTPTFSLSATSNCQIDYTVKPHVGRPETATEICSVSAHAIFGTRDDARAYVAASPKSWRLKASYVTGPKDVGCIYFDASFSADKSNKGTNEAGLKRLRAFLARVSYTYCEPYYLNAATPEQFAKFLETGSIL